MNVVMGYKFIEFAHPFIVFCNAGVKMAVSIPELDTPDRFDVIFAAGFYKIDHSGGIVDVGKRERFDIVLNSKGDQPVYIQCPVS